MIKRAPRVYAYLDHSEIGFAAGCHHFSELLRLFAKVSPYVRTNTVLTSEEQMENGLGLDPINNMDEVIQALLENRKQDELFDRVSKRVWAERWKDSRAIVEIEYVFNSIGSMAPNYLDCDINRKASDADNFSLSHWLHIIETIIRWRRPIYLWCGDAKYWRDDLGVFAPERTIANWFCWVPQQVEPSQIPSAAIVRPMLDGTLIASLEQYFNIGHLEAIQRVNDVEVEMNEAGILPHHTELNNN